MSGLRDLLIIDAADIARLGDYLALVDALEAAHRQPPAAVERIVYGPDGHAERLLALPAWQAGEAIGVKLVTVFPGNPATNGLPSVQAVVVLFDGGTGSAAGADRRHRADLPQDRRRLGARARASCRVLTRARC